MNTLVPNRARIQSIDLLRGLVMIIMALDHTRDFFHAQAMTEDPLNPATTTPILYFTRWITHFCAPVFVFLAGTSAYLQSLRKTKKELSLFLIKRGIWLVLLEMTLITFSFGFDIYFSVIGLQTIWSIGISMIILGLFIWLPFQVILVSGLLVVLGHNLLDLYEKDREVFSAWYSLLHRPGIIPLGKDHSLLAFYPFLSWAGLMLVGYCFGRLLYNNEGAERKKVLTWLGLGIILFFIAVRVTDIYGDPDVLTDTDKPLNSLYSFLEVSKYPPSLLYMCMTIGPALLFMAWTGNTQNRLTKIISVYGRVPFFYYILHFYLLHTLTMLSFFARGHSVEEGTKNAVNVIPNFVMPGEGYSLWIVYLIWIVVVIALYPVCKWYDTYKTRHKEKWWLSYL
ncbi:MAG TPA: heparan-alpha-glucosaminide N-acetyltransferase domain-containing protein [Ferruginibacter sp.]|nr:heparan-alpha-glucosaminide N-acetyltransferase domain-containing protein [Ferruginibacter sp.]